MPCQVERAARFRVYKSLELFSHLFSILDGLREEGGRDRHRDKSLPGL